MDWMRHALASVVLVSIPPAVGLWYAIHPFARFWRTLGPRVTYLILAVPAFALGWALWLWRDALLGRDLGARPWLMLVAAAAVAAGVWLRLLRRRHLTGAILVGVPELSAGGQGHLLTTGIYARIRNPRYLEYAVFALAYVAVADYLGTWVLWVLLLPALHVVVLLEERELRDRFGQEYVDYCRRVPRYLPSARSS